MDKCAIVKDLLPLYADDVCSIESKKLVAEHLSECEECCKELESYELNVITGNVAEKEAVKKFKKKTEKKVAVKVVSIVLAVCIGLFGAYNAYWYCCFKAPFIKYQKAAQEIYAQCRDNNISPIDAVLGEDNSYGIDTDEYESLEFQTAKGHNYYTNGGCLDIYINRPLSVKEVLYSDKEALKDIGITISVSKGNNLSYSYLVMFDFLVDENDNDIYFYIDEDMNLILNTENNYEINYYHDINGMSEKQLQEKHNDIREEIYKEVSEDLRVMMIVLHEAFGIGNVKA